MNQLYSLLFKFSSYIPSSMEILRYFILKYSSNGCGKFVYISKYSMVDYPKNIEYGNNIYIGKNFKSFGAGMILIGSGTYISPSVTILTTTHDIMTMNEKYKNVYIGKYCWIATNATILPGVKIGEGAVVAAGAVVTKDVEPYTVVMGNPSRYIKTRDRNKMNNYRLPLGIDYIDISKQRIDF